MNEKLKVLKIIHLFMCTGILFIYFLIGDLFSIEKFNLPAIDSSNVVYCIIPLIAILLGNFLYRSQINKADKRAELEKNIPVYLNATIIRLAILETGALIILFLKPDFLLFGLLIIIYMIFVRPSASQLKGDFKDR